MLGHVQLLLTHTSRGGDKLGFIVNADNLLVTGDGALNFVANIAGTTVSVFAAPVGEYNDAQKV